MDRIIDRIFEKIISLFQIGKADNIIIKRKIDKGFSMAEVYLVELRGDSNYKGNYILKIDISDQEYRNAQNGYCFKNVAKILKSEKIENYYVLLMEIAGQSSIEYKAFYDIEDLSVRKKSVKRILLSILEQATQDKLFVGEQVLAPVLFKEQLSSKLNDNAVLNKYVQRLTGAQASKDVTGFLFETDAILPNAFAYAVDNSLWQDKKISNMNCCVHGDLHGNNIFYCHKSQDFSLIDLDLYRDDGYVFFDIAYFELSLLLHDFLNMDLMCWIKNTSKMASCEWEKIDCRDKQTFAAIVKCENLWIDRKCSEKFNYKDNLIEAQCVARVLAGMNYAGKKKVSEEIRRKAFLYSCIYMKKLLEIKGIDTYRKNVIKWGEIGYDSSLKNEISTLLLDMDKFSDSKKYVLVLGDNYNYESEICEALNRINWTGFVTFRKTERIEKILRKYNIVNVLTVDEDLNLLTLENLWFVYANGVTYKAETLCENFPEWRNRYSVFFAEISKKLDLVVAPDELQYIVDLESFSNEYLKHLERFCESLDLIKNASVNIAFISKRKEEIFKNEDFEQIKCKFYLSDIESVADFCLKYLKGIEENEITIPALCNTRKRLPESEYKFVKVYVTLLHNRIIQYEGQVDVIEKRLFYCGKKILWQAIEEKLYIEIKEMREYTKKIDQEATKDNNQFLVRLVHSPGAGASVLCRVLAWNYRNDYPVVIAENMNKNISECIQKIYSCSGKRVLLFLDGDFSENDVNQLMQCTREMRVKVGIIFLYRSYGAQETILSSLTVEDALKFSNIYTKQMKEIMDYSEEIVEERKNNMHNLATINSLINYRMPFFFGVNAFEKDLVSIQEYLDRISQHITRADSYKKIICYIALITYYTEGQGLNINYVKKILKLGLQTSVKEILLEINGEIDNFIYYSNGVFKICHSVVAFEILKQEYSMNTLEFEEFMEGFVHDICLCEKGRKISNRLNDLFMNLFIKRDIEGDIADNLKKKNFSPLIMALENSNLQEKFFAFLINEIPDNAHFRQHYGRLIIYNNPGKLEQAKEQFDEAIRLEPSNPLHYHSRGNMYTKYVINLCRIKYNENNIQELYDGVAQITEEAISDYETSIQTICETKDAVMGLSYPYASIIQTITYVVHQLFLRHASNIEEKEFLALNNTISIWCRSLIHKAEQYDMNTEHRYDSIRENQVYSNVRYYLTKYKYAHSEIEQQLTQHPDDINIIKEYMYTLDTKKDRWENKTQDELKKIINCCRILMRDEKSNSDGIMWRWFNGCINCNDIELAEMLALLETVDDFDNNLTAHFMLYTIKLGIFFKNYDEKLIKEINNHIECCKRLSSNSNRNNTRYYYNASGKVGFCYSRESGIFVDGTVVKWDSPQNGHVSLDINPKLNAFFVPSVIGMREEGAIGTKVRLRLGVSFDGLRAWDLQVKE